MPLVADSLRSLSAGLVVAALAVAALVLGKVVLMPLAIATCLAFVLAPIVTWATSRMIPHSLAVALVIAGATSLVASLAFLLAAQTVSLTASLKTYETNLIAKARALAGAAKTDGAIKRAADAIESLERNIARELKPAPRAATPDADKVIVTSSDTPLWHNAALALHIGAYFGLTLLFTLFMLLQSDDLRDRVVRLAGTENVSGTTAALADAAQRLSRLFLVLAMMNAGFGVVAGMALWTIGVPNSLLWGALAFLMRFVPYVGSAIAAIPPVLLAAAVDPGWGMAIATLMVFLIGEAVMGHVVEPLALGPQAGMSPFAMLISASFWALVWGPPGLVLAAPLTMVLVVIGRYIEGLAFVSVLLGDEPALSPEQRIYHRLLARDTLAAVQCIEEEASNSASIGELADVLLIPALKLAASDLEMGRLDRKRAAEFNEAVADLLGEIAPASSGSVRSRSQNGGVLIVPARTSIDSAAASAVERAVESAVSCAVSAATQSTGLAALAQAAADGKDDVDAVVIVATGPGDAQYLPLIVRRATATFPNTRVMLLDATGSNTAVQPPATRYTRASELIAQISHIAEKAEELPMGVAEVTPSQ